MQRTYEITKQPEILREHELVKGKIYRICAGNNGDYLNALVLSTRNLEHNSRHVIAIVLSPNEDQFSGIWYVTEETPNVESFRYTEVEHGTITMRW